MSGTGRNYDVIIVGAGIIGPALAVGLGKQGRSVLVIERDLKEPDRIVGELLQPGGVQALKKLGIEHTLENINAVKCKGYQVILHGEQVNIPYPKLPSDDNNNSTNEKTPTNKQALGVSFHHGKFINNLRDAAKNTPNVTFLEATVSEVIKNPHTEHVLGVKCVDKSKVKRHFFASLTLMTDGIYSNFRKQFSDTAPQIKSHFAGLVLKDAVLPAAEHGNVIIGNHQPILVYQIDPRETRILCDIAGLVPSNSTGALKEHLKRHVLPHLPTSLHPSFEKALESQRIRTMPAQYLTATPHPTVGLVLVGDSLNMRHPLTGGGMTVAFNDAVLLTEALSPENVSDLSDVHAVEKQLQEFYLKRKKVNSVINVLAMALYSLFAADDANLKVLQTGCFKYFQRGGKCVSLPVSLLSGLLTDPVVLFNEFFKVAFYAVFLNLTSHGIAGFPYAVFQIFSVIWTACVVFIPFMWQEAKWW